MKEILEKLSSYNIFNNLLPGVIFSLITEKITSFDVAEVNVLVGVFVCYFLGVIISRVGSLVLEPALIKIGLIKYCPYEDYVRASKIDPVIDVLSEANNMYRTICALLITVSAMFGYSYAAHQFHILKSMAPAVCIASLLCLFLLSYRKQTAYISKRVAAHK